MLRSRISDPLGLEATVFTDGATGSPAGLAAGWELALGQVGDLEANGEALRAIAPTATTVGDVAAFLTALNDGRLLSAEGLATMFDERVTRSGFGLERHEEFLGDLGDLGARYFTTGGGLPSGYNVDAALDPASGNLVVVLANNIELDTVDFMRDTVRAWAPDSPSSPVFEASDAAGTTHLLINVTCDYGQLSVLERPECDSDDESLYLTMSNAGQRTGPFEGVQVVDGIAVIDPEDGSFSYTGLVTFAGSVEGCGTGTVFLEAAGEGYTEASGANTFTSNTLTAVTGGTLHVTGAIDETGTEVQQDDGTVTMAYTATYEC